ncbi:putative DNA-binding protein (MmcQ/YjbR family) [Spinactinospora alkalitolerans]|uniref:Putative DNA-binding protein (MmcQ/YjbR family) n=1 Tax=Spinactinospora alkalitolerans TaxID=687207 RepID=A0A852U2K5_9ACTN|nr:MmcQ/YjbR family DNA-binding protein [Spinactinospora alkalitolerans]NYE50458.1 putative DNA-binding protein (MmcQ/YjbR family) [Spinactinospora alkalitolerans]
MKGRKLQDAAREVAEELPASTMGHPFGPEYEVFKVKGKVFMLLTEVPGDPIVVLKADPEDSKALRQSHRDITPGYHMNKKHWITLEPGESVDKGLVKDLVTDSYRLVVAGLPRAQRPVDPESFGAAGEE